jgi:probable HAF family extracellular repeat protein
MRIISLAGLGAVALIVGSLGATVAQAARYHIVDLGTKYDPTDMNDRGELSGNIEDQDRGVIFQRGHWRLLPVHYGGPSEAMAINSGGDVGGLDAGSPGFWPRGGAFTPLSLPPDADGGGYVSDLSDQQVIVGFYQTTQGFACFRWSAADGGVNLGLMGKGDYCWASAINAAGQIVGYGDTEPGGVAHAFLYENGVFRDLGTLDGSNTYATDVNRRGHVAGWTASSTSFLWKDGQMIDLRAGTPYAMVDAERLNDRDEVVGAALDAFGVLHAVLFADGHVTDLETEVDALHDWQLYDAFVINNLGEIVGWGYRTNEQRDHNFMLVPIP